MERSLQHQGIEKISFGVAQLPQGSLRRPAFNHHVEVPSGLEYMGDRVPTPARTGKVGMEDVAANDVRPMKSAARSDSLATFAFLNPPVAPVTRATVFRHGTTPIDSKSDCDGCALRSRCLSGKTPTRTVYRQEHEAVLDRHRARMQGAAAQMRRRAELAETHSAR